MTTSLLRRTPPPTGRRGEFPSWTRLRSVVLLSASLLAGAAACGHEVTAAPSAPDTGTGTGTGGVASVVVAGVPSTVVLVGDSLRLVATAVNATGGVVSDQSITWRSSVPAVAAVRADGTVIALGSGKAVITASVKGHDGAASLDIADGGTLGTSGGTLRAAAGAVMLAVPAGSLAQATLLMVRQATNAPPDARVVSRTAFELGPDGTNFLRLATLTMTFDAASVPTGLAGESLQLYMQSGTTWTVVPASRVDLAARTVTGTISRAGVYAVRSTPVGRVVLAGSAVGGALYAGQAAQIDVALYASTGDSLRAQPIAWTSSDSTKVAIDAAGRLSARAPGVVTLAALVDGKSATTQVTVLGRPSADWSRATEWTTYQGDARHSGYSPAVVDPGVFRERWAVTPVAGASYFQPTAGGGQVYLATNGYFGSQTLRALDAADGSLRWLRDFGSIYGINQPTYDNQSVYITTGGHEDTFIYALSATDGARRYQTAFASQWEHWNAPVVVGSTIVTAGGYYGGMYGFELATGKQTFFLDGAQVSGWAPAAAGGRIYVVGSISGGGVRVITPADGKVVGLVTDARVAAVVTPVVGDANDLLTIIGNRLTSTNLGTMSVAWDESGGYTGMPVVGGGVVYAAGSGGLTARRESDGAQLWTWSPPTPFKTVQALALTSNVLFATVAGDYGGPTATVAIDLASHLTVWSYPMGGSLALAKEGALYIVQGPKVVAINIR